MAVATEKVAEQYFDVSTGTPIDVDIPLYEATDVIVVYGNEALVAVLNVDYTIDLSGDFNTFTLTPLASLLEKINNLIAADATEINYITVRRELDYLTSTTAAAVRYTPFTSKEFDRTAMRFQQVEERLNRALVLSSKNVGGVPQLELTEKEANTALVFDATGDKLIPGPTVTEISAAQTYATEAGASATAAEAWAENPEDDPVSVASGGDGATTYSAKHHARKAATSATAALTAAAALVFFTANSLTSAATLDLSGFDAIQINRFADDTPIAPAVYQKVAQPGNVEPTHAAKFQDTSGAWFAMVAGDSVNLASCGGKPGDYAEDNGAAIQLAHDVLPDGGGEIRVPKGAGATGSASAFAEANRWAFSTRVSFLKPVKLAGEGRYASVLYYQPTHFALKYDGETAPFTVGQTVTGATSGAAGVIASIVDDGATGTLTLTSINSKYFQDNEAITDGAGGAALANGVQSSVAITTGVYGLVMESVQLIGAPDADDTIYTLGAVGISSSGNVEFYNSTVSQFRYLVEYQGAFYHKFFDAWFSRCDTALQNFNANNVDFHGCKFDTMKRLALVNGGAGPMTFYGGSIETVSNIAIGSTAGAVFAVNLFGLYAENYPSTAVPKGVEKTGVPGETYSAMILVVNGGGPVTIMGGMYSTKGMLRIVSNSVANASVTVLGAYIIGFNAAPNNTMDVAFQGGTDFTLVSHGNVTSGTSSGAWSSSVAKGSGRNGFTGEPLVFTEEAWTAPAFVNGWANDTTLADAEPAGYYKDATGRVYLRGLLNAAASTATTAFTLPVGYRPPYRIYMAGHTASGTVVMFRINTDGTVATATATTATLLSIAGMSFRTL